MESNNVYIELKHAEVMFRQKIYDMANSLPIHQLQSLLEDYVLSEREVETYMFSVLLENLRDRLELEPYLDYHRYLGQYKERMTESVDIGI